MYAPEKKSGWRHHVYTVIFGTDTYWGKAFDITLIWAIILSILIVLLDSVQAIHTKYGHVYYVLEWGFTLLFGIEYVLRLVCIRKPLKYAVSFMGIIDLLAILPTLISFFIVGTQYLIVIRALRILRVFRILKMWNYIQEARVLMSAMYSSYVKISIFLLFILVLVTILGSVMYLIEGGENGFDSIPSSIYWAIVTLTTVGYGDISPVTTLGKIFASFIMLCGYGIIAVPTGIVTSEIFAAGIRSFSAKSCPGCGRDGHERDAKFCKFCGTEL